MWFGGVVYQEGTITEGSPHQQREKYRHCCISESSEDFPNHAQTKSPRIVLRERKNRDIIIFKYQEILSMTEYTIV